MKNLMWVLMMICEIAGAKTLNASYEVSYGIFQKMGIADASLEIRDDKSYTIRVEARTVGIAKILSGNRYEVYESRGMVDNGKLIPMSYFKIRHSNGVKNMKYYTFDHKNKVVWRETTETEDGEIRKDKVQNDYYAQEDILSLFFNLKYYAKSERNSVFYAIGGNKKDGRIDAVVLKDEKMIERIKAELDTQSGDYVKVALNERIFSSANGELLINIDNSGVCEKAVLSDVLLFGDIVGKRVR